MNPCPCGYAGSRGQSCRCTPAQLLRYQSKLSGPLLDRIDLQVVVTAVDPTLLLTHDKTVDTAITDEEARAQVSAVWKIQSDRASPNAQLEMGYFGREGVLDSAARKLCDKIVSTKSLSARAVVRWLRVARAIADLSHAKCITDEHLHESFGYRQSPILPM